MTQLTGLRMAIPIFKTPVETITSPYYKGEKCNYKVRLRILKSFSA